MRRIKKLDRAYGTLYSTTRIGRLAAVELPLWNLMTSATADHLLQELLQCRH